MFRQVAIVLLRCAATARTMLAATTIALTVVLAVFESATGWNDVAALPCRRISASRVSLSVGESPAEPSLSRRQALLAGSTGIASIFFIPRISRAETATVAPSSTSLLSDYNPLDYKTLPSLGRSTFPPPFIPPFNNRATYRYSLGRNSFALEQLLAFANVTATIRTNVIKMDDGGLWVCNPLYPTEEYCALLNELGPVKHVVLASNALEHKAAMKQFLQKYPQVDDVWISPGQYGPFGECGIVTDGMSEEEVTLIVKEATKTMKYRVDGILPVQTQSTKATSKPRNMYPSWKDTFDMATLCVELHANAGPVSEVAFVHKATNTLVVTDAVICVPDVSADVSKVTESPPTFPLQPIFSTYDKFDESTLNNPTFWARTVLQAVFLPLRVESNDPEKEVYPGFEAIKNRLVRAPILRSFDDARAPDAVREWVKDIASLQRFDRIITGHFASPINAGPKLFTEAFAYLDGDASTEKLRSTLPPIACKDWSTLNSLNDVIDNNKLGAPVVYDFWRGCIE